MTFGATAASEAGWKVTVRPYAYGEAGIRQSLEEVSRLMRLAKDDPDVKRWAVHVLAARGIDGRDRPSVRTQSSALLDAFRAQTIYVPDSAGAEHIQAAHVTLCLRDRCIPGEDCESLCIGLGGAMLSIGLPVYAVKVDYGPGEQQHLLLGLLDETGNRFYADPSTTKPLLDYIPGAKDVTWVDPLDQVGTLGTVGPEIVTLGAPRRDRELFFKSGCWIEHRYGRWWSHREGKWSEVRGGFGKPVDRDGHWWMLIDGVEVQLNERQVSTFGLGQAIPVSVTNQTPYTQVTDGQVHAGLRYRVAIQLTFTSDPSQTDPQTIEDQFSGSWYIESFDAQDQAQIVPGLNQWIQTFLLQGIALQDQQLTNSSTINYLVVGVQSSNASPQPTSTPAAIPPPQANGNVSLVAASLVAAVVGGVGYGLWKKGYFGGRRG